MRKTWRSLVAVPTLIASLLLGAQIAFAVIQANSGLVPNNGSWAHYNTERCATYFGGPFQLVNSWPGTAVYMYIRDPSTGNPLGPTRTFPENDTGWRDMGDLGSGNCFKISGHKDWTDFFGSQWWTGSIDY
jgi:hypothetical protein